MGVWIETLMQEKLLGKIASHPVWVCGLKQVLQREQIGNNKSHPVWVCGLKLAFLKITQN